ncbi:MAG: hypothetical protein MZU84_07330 [Sphingobacterium sp.]|nr:hypothetical protein [Sphingobacterium sp.]
MVIRDQIREGYEWLIFHGSKVKIFAVSSNRELAAGDRRTTSAFPCPTARSRRFADGEIQHQHQRNGPRPQGLRHSVHLQPGQRESDGTAHHDRRAEARRRPARSTSVMPYYGYCPPGPQGQAPRQPISAKLVADLITGRRRDPRHLRRPARRPDPGLLQHPDRQLPRHADPRSSYIQAKNLDERRRRLARPRRRRARAERSPSVLGAPICDHRQDAVPNRTSPR